MKKFFNLVFSKAFLLNILGILVFFVIAIIILMASLRSCTRHGEKVTVPTVVGMEQDEALALLEREGFKDTIISILFIDTLPKGVIVEQVPTPESQVKPGRTIYLKVNSSEDIYIPMPDFVGHQSKTLENELKKYKLKLDKIKYQRHGEEKNIVLKQMYNGRQIKPGTEIKQGSAISFIVAGNGPEFYDEDEQLSTSTNSSSDTNESGNESNSTPASDEEDVNFDI